jgi:hypothetical protein
MEIQVQNEVNQDQEEEEEQQPCIDPWSLYCMQ